MANSIFTYIIITIAVSGWVLCIYTLYRLLVIRKHEIQIVREILSDIQNIKKDIVRK